MRRQEREIKDRQEIETIIEMAQICRIGMAENGVPYIVPMNFGYKDNSLYFHCAPEGKKLDIIKSSPRVCFEMEADYELLKTGDVPCGWSTKYSSVMGTGKAFIINDEEEKRKALNIIIGHYGTSRYDFSEEELGKAGVIRIEIEEMTGKRNG